MEITIIHGQQHRGSTYHMTEILKNHLAGADTVVNEYFLPRDGPDFCVGWFGCITKGETHCPHANKVQPVVAAPLRAQILIFDSPTYCFGDDRAISRLFSTIWDIFGCPTVPGPGCLPKSASWCRLRPAQEPVSSPSRWTGSCLGGASQGLPAATPCQCHVLARCRSRDQAKNRTPDVCRRPTGSRARRPCPARSQIPGCCLRSCAKCTPTTPGTG